MLIRTAVPEDKAELGTLYREVARLSQGIARMEHEITPGYIDSMFEQATQQGLMLVAVDPDSRMIVAEMHASTYGIEIFSHILTNLTIVVKPAYQGRGVGKQLFRTFLNEVDTNWPQIKRIELESRSSNRASIGLYERLGFVQEGTMTNKTRNADGRYEDSLLLARTSTDVTF
ncbi:GNAT family N-acetyltransferase [Spirosoma rigui]|uniref:GNAT family N-acetyltransferase n=1 Tax=Spirosoma rigui TaxID=564064 RepID=UPI0009B18476|nr:GNAT family N-acetyltransferase [Spirosoma rigui]